MLKCVFVVEIWPFKSGPRRQKWGKNGGNGGGEKWARIPNSLLLSGNGLTDIYLY